MTERTSPDSLWLRIAQASTRSPRRTLALALLAVLLAAPGMLRLTLRTDGHALVPLADPAVVYDDAVRDRFGLRDPILVTVEREGGQGVYDVEVLRTVERLTREFAGLPLVVAANLDSLATEKRDRVYPGTLDFRPFLDPLPESPELLAVYREDLLAMPLLAGTLVSQDYGAAAILVGAPNPLDDQGQPTADRIALYRDLAARSAEVQATAAPGIRIEIVGAPVAEALLGLHILEDLRFLVPASLAVLALVIGLASRSLWGAFLGMAKIGAAVVWTFGVMGWFGVPVFLTTAVLPVILTPIGLSDEIHLLWRYRERLAGGDAGALGTALRELVWPITLTSLTTGVGLLSFVFSPLVAVRAFGVFGTLGVLFCLAWALTATPAALALLGPERLLRRRTRPVRASRLAAWLRPALARPRTTLAALAAVTLVAALGAARLEVQDSWVDGFAPGSPFRVATERIDQEFNGTHLLLAVFELDRPQEIETDPDDPFAAPPPPPLRDPKLLAALDRFETEVAALPGVGAAIGPAAQLKTVRFLRFVRRPEMRSIPASPAEVTRLIGWYDQVRGPERRRQVIDDEGLGGVVTLFLKQANYQQVAKIVEAVEDAAERHLTGTDSGLPVASRPRLGFAGDIAVSQAMIPAIVRSQILSLGTAVLGALLLVGLVERSLRRALILAAPVLSAVVWTLGIMGWVGIPLGVATSMFCSITLGIGIDYGIHLLEVHRRRRAESTGAAAEASLAAATEAGPAILVDMLAVAAGFGLLAFSQVPANARLGLLVALALCASAVLTLWGLAAMLVVFFPSTSYTSAFPSHEENHHMHPDSRLRSFAALGAALVAMSCAPNPSAPVAAKPTPEAAKAFTEQAETVLRDRTVEAGRAGWVQENFITVDTEAIAAQAQERLISEQMRLAGEAANYAGLELPYDVDRKLKLLKTAITLPAPRDPAKASELTKITTSMTSTYGKGEYCPPGKECRDLGALSSVIAKSRKPDELLEAWQGWHAISRPIRPEYQRFVELSNEGARELGFADTGALWRSGYDMDPNDFAAELDRLWSQVKPLYDSLHCYTRGKLVEKYGPEVIKPDGMIPAHLLGNMWAQTWANVYDVVGAGDSDPGYDLTKILQGEKYDAEKMVKTGEAFFTSLGFAPLPATFWERSLFVQPKDREVVCHASAWSVDEQDDLRIKMCIEINDEDFATIHHELGHNFYQRAYKDQPFLYHNSANDGFHEAIGDTIALSVTPAYLVKLGLLEKEPPADADVGLLLKLALDKVAFMPFGLLIDQWRWKVFNGEIPPGQYNQAWWDLRAKYQGVMPPVARTEEDFDAGAKYHVPANTPYTRYFLAHILQFQFHRDLCRQAGITGPLHRCSIYGNKEVGQRLDKMLAMGSSRPWPEALEALTGSKQMDASAVLDYFAPLKTWLDEQNKGQKCGW